MIYFPCFSPRIVSKCLVQESQKFASYFSVTRCKLGKDQAEMKYDQEVPKPQSLVRYLPSSFFFFIFFYFSTDYAIRNLNLIIYTMYLYYSVFCLFQEIANCRRDVRIQPKKMIPLANLVRFLILLLNLE